MIIKIKNLRFLLNVFLEKQKKKKNQERFKCNKNETLIDLKNENKNAKTYR